MPTHSEQIDDLMSKFADAQGEFAVPKKTHTATIKTDKGTYTYKYSTLDELIEATRPALTKAGILCRTVSQIAGGKVTVHVRLDKGPQWWMSDAYEWPAGGSITAAGGVLTYLRRYAMGTELNVAAEEDNDSEPGEIQNESARSQPQRPQPQRPQPATAAAAPAAAPATTARAKDKPINEQQRKRLFAIAKVHGVTNEQIKVYIKAKYKIDSTSGIMASMYDALVSRVSEGNLVPDAPAEQTEPEPPAPEENYGG